MIFAEFLKLCLTEKTHELRRLKTKEKMLILAWKEKRVLLQEIARWLGRYRWLFVCLVANAKNLPIPSQKLCLGKVWVRLGGNCHHTCEYVQVCLAANMSKHGGIADFAGVDSLADPVGPQALFL
jgi:hypothetical protein